ncbi:MAG: Na+/H+ antiporter subunit G [Sphingomonas sp.]|uniref:Na+/H+ antiporter subunit G n=1 Tax=Sphingomonas sp. TaxID=28214 RepID=UPI0025D55D1D|nr:Na+/H+ antiporter subunit G [Sphingomonas sp.]MBX3564399.1 Na+/H+ antiporter subunit G [Sphingomonas sp.]
MIAVVELLIAALVVLGGAFALIGSWGLVRLPSIMERLHGPTKATTLGLGALLIASMLFFTLVQGTWSAHELLITLFLFLTAPIAANMIAKAHLHRARRHIDGERFGPAGDPPRPGADTDWATFAGDTDSETGVAET